jgi:flagellar biosynthesis/type III secretory pathway M-ring protein FliF/YscJ
MLPFPASPAASTPSQPVEPVRRLPLVGEPETPVFREDLLPVYAGLALSLILLLLLLRVRQHRRSQEEEIQAAASPPEETLEARLGGLRQQVMDDPKVAASVVKLWIQNS